MGRTNNLGPEAANQDVNKAVLMEAVVIQMTWPGAPTVYYGDEAGLCGFTDPDSRRTYPWGREDRKLIEFHRAIIRMHRKNPEFRRGSTKWLHSDYNFIAYGRFNRTHHSVILINNNDHEITKEMTVWELGIPREAEMTRLMFTSEKGFSTEPEICEVTAGRINVTMPRTSAMVLAVYECGTGDGAPESEKKFLADPVMEGRTRAEEKAEGGCGKPISREDDDREADFAAAFSVLP